MENEKKVHPLRRWMIHNNITSPQLAEISGIKAGAIRYICCFNVASVKRYRILSDATGIPPLVLMFPEEHASFDVSGCRANNIHVSITC